MLQFELLLQPFVKVRRLDAYMTEEEKEEEEGEEAWGDLAEDLEEDVMDEDVEECHHNKWTWLLVSDAGSDAGPMLSV